MDGEKIRYRKVVEGQSRSDAIDDKAGISFVVDML